MYSAQIETQMAAEDDKNEQIVSLLGKYWPDARKQIYDYDTDWDKYKNNPKKIIIHHSASEACNDVAISRYHRDNTKNGTEWRNTSKKTLLADATKPESVENSDIRYHYIIQPNGSVENVRYEDEVWWGTRTHNIDTIHIMLCGNFDITEPTKEQYSEWWFLINQLKSKYWDLPVYTHWELEPNSCAGDKLDVNKFGFDPKAGKPQAKTDEQIISNAGLIKPSMPKVTTWQCRAKKWMKCLWIFNEITAYYSPTEDQGRYFAPDGKNERNYYAEQIINGDLTPANGMFYLDSHKYTHGACGYDLLRKKLWIEGRSEKHGVFTCVDRGSAIDENDIDIWYGIWRQALNAIDGKDNKNKQVEHPQTAMVYEVL